LAAGNARSAQIICTKRTDAEQAAEYAKGRTQPGRIVTYADGIVVKSKHQELVRHGEDAVHALDALLLIGGVSDWRTKSYEIFMRAGEAEGLVSGLDWNDNGILDANERGTRGPRGPQDGPHLECSGKVFPIPATDPTVLIADPTVNHPPVVGGVPGNPASNQEPPA
jgi:hypothetical protein